ncbi:hypothetical protein JQC91_07345 [Jannaschia sp. Os4]|uniref:hypothetical protein n=1 Tax=Jannaschia sp. Os4 TaxID=2807617 RepID=UPI001939F570|nr:hypothetical protein [Jannaschia sp. Os4]MBM2576116.1 hypothetical protein [Jannaschia sp. Os4]
MFGFLKGEAGAVTVDWVVMTVAVAGIGTAVVAWTQFGNGTSPTDRADAQFDSYMGPSPNGNGPSIPPRPVRVEETSAPTVLPEAPLPPVEETGPDYGGYNFAAYQPSYLNPTSYSTELIPLIEGYSTASILYDVQEIYDAAVSAIGNYPGSDYADFWVDAVAATLTVLDERGEPNVENHAEIVETLAEAGYIAF